jgi:hypothetical protein
MSIKAMMRTLTITACVTLGVAGTAAVASAAVVHPDTCVATVSIVCPDTDGGAGNG